MANHRAYKAYKKRLIKRQGNKCHYCGEFMMFPTLDHKTPRKITGRSKRSVTDTVMCCYPCNREKDDMPYKDYVLFKARLFVKDFLGHI